MMRELLDRALWFFDDESRDPRLFGPGRPSLREPPPEKPGLYRLIRTDNGKIWYIGHTNDLERRISEHRRSFETLNGSRPGRLLERASQKRRISAFEIWNLIRLPSTAQKETAGEAAPVRPHAHLKHVRGGSGGAGILDNACGGKVLRSPSAIGFFRGCEPVRELTQAPSRPDIRPIASTLSRVCSPGCTGSIPISITWPSVTFDQIDVHRPDTATLQLPWYSPRNGCSRKPG